MANKIGIVGAGAMGQGIAQVALNGDGMVYLYDANPSVPNKAIDAIRSNLAKQIEKGKLSQSAFDDKINRLFPAANITDLHACNIVIEAIVEDLAVKQTIFKEIENTVDEICLLATNTSSLSVTSIAAACKKPQRVIGMHFFNPAPIMPLLEIIPAVQTSPSTVEKALEFGKIWGKTTVLAKDTPGFIVNRIARPFYGEAIRILEEGIADAATIDAAMTFIGEFKMGPFALMDFIGHDVNYSVTESIFQSFFYDPRYKPSFTQKRLVEAGYLGRKTGRGFYKYPATEPDTQITPDPRLARKIFERIISMLINEAADALFLGIASKEDIDMAMQKGTNYPQGLLAWADDMGIAYVVSILHGLYAEYQEDRYRCSPLLQRMAVKYKQFY